MNFKVWNIYKAWRQKIWLRVVAIACLAVLAVILAQLLAPYVPVLVAFKAGSEAVSQILEILASSMLAVTTFSLSIAVTGFGTAAATATPRATALLQEDTTTQNVLATFIGAFLFSLLGLIALNAKLFSESGKVVLYLFTIAVVLLVVIALIRWIGHLMSFGRMDYTLDKVETAARDALSARLATPYLGGRAFNGSVPLEAIEVAAPATGYVEHVDMPALQALAEELKGEVYVPEVPGSFVVERGAIAFLHVESVSDEEVERVKAAFAIGPQRAFDDDPRFGLIVFSEIASRALSPAVNDPGTAISVLGRLVRVLTEWHNRVDLEPEYPSVYISSIAPAEAIEDAFRPIARDGAEIIEVQVRLQKALSALRESVPDAFDQPCADMADYALALATGAGLPDAEIAMLRRLSQSGTRRKTGRADMSI